MHFDVELLTTTLAVALAVRRWKTAPVIFAGVVVLICGLRFLGAAGAAQPPAVRERTAPRNAGVRRLASIHWERVPLRDAMARVSDLFSRTVFIDRRVDPSLRVTLKLESASIDEVLQSVADTLSLGASRLGELRYLGPRQAAEQLRTVAVVRSEELASLPRAERFKLDRKLPLTWPRLSEPRTLVDSVADRHGWRIKNAERIPHDLWAAGALPQLSSAEQLTLLLIGFELTFIPQSAERALEIVPLEEVTLRREYRLPNQSADAIAPLRQELSAARSARMEATKLIVDARVEQHERLAELLAGTPSRQQSRRSQTQSQRVYTLRVQEQPVNAILRQLAEQLRWNVEFDEASIRAAGLSTEARVSFSVENSTEEELLEAILTPAGLDYRREGDQLRIVPRATRD